MEFIATQNILVVLGLAGFVLAYYIHSKKSKKKRLICPRKADCNTVVNSDYSKIFGIPVEVLGIFYYSFITGYNLILLNPNSFLLTSIYNPSFLIYISLAAAVFSLYLIFIQAFKIRQWCLWCIGSAMISILIFAISALKFLF